MDHKLRPFWQDSTPEQAFAAPDLISLWLPSVLRRALSLQRCYPSEDVETRLVYGLFKAAYSYRPERCSFTHWLYIKTSGELAGLKKAIQRRERHGIYFQTLDPNQEPVTCQTL
jgi:hypothetical protein